MAAKPKKPKKLSAKEKQKIYDTHLETIKDAITEAGMDCRLPTIELKNLMEEVERFASSALDGLHCDLEAQGLDD